MIELLFAAVVANVVSPVVIRLRSADWLWLSAANTVAAVADQVDHRGVLDVEHLEQVGRVGRERRQVAEHVVEVLVVAPDRLGELLLPLSERGSGARVKRVEDLVELDGGLDVAAREHAAVGERRAVAACPGVSST